MVLAGLVACGGEAAEGKEVPSWHFVLDTQMDAASAELVTAAIEDWRAALPCEATITVARGLVALGPLPAHGTIEAMVGPLPASAAEGSTATCTASAPITARGARTVFLPELDGKAALRRAARHEIGHAFGLPHAPSGAMREVEPEELSASDVEAYAARWCER